MTAFTPRVPLTQRAPATDPGITDPDPPSAHRPRAGWVDPQDSPTALTIAMVGDANTRSGAAEMVARLAELAVTDELLVVYGLNGHESTTGVRVMVAGLRGLLPRHAVVAVHVAPHNGSLDRDADLLDDLLDVGSMPIATTPAAVVLDVAAELCDRLAADRVMVMSQTPVGGFALHEIWHRRTAIGSRLVSSAA